MVATEEIDFLVPVPIPGLLKFTVGFEAVMERELVIDLPAFPKGAFLRDREGAFPAGEEGERGMDLLGLEYRLDTPGLLAFVVSSFVSCLLPNTF